VLLAPGRAHRPGETLFHRVPQPVSPARDCPFEASRLQKETPLLFLGSSERDWRILIIENKYPALRPGHTRIQNIPSKFYKVLHAEGYHHILITRDHKKNFSQLSTEDALLVFRAFQTHYQTLARHSSVRYVSFFQNKGIRGGATLYHPHFQILALPIVPSDVEESLLSSHSYFRLHKKCVYCSLLQREREEKKRVIYENERALVFAPFISRQPFEVRVFPKHHSPYFEDEKEDVLRDVSSALQFVLRRMKTRLFDPDYNFFLHSAPVYRKKAHASYHWHIEVVPRLTTAAGFELGTGIDVNVVDPDEAARVLRFRKKIKSLDPKAFNL